MNIFTYDAWAMSIFLIIISSAAFMILENVGRANFHGNNDSEEFTMVNSLALSLGLLIQNSYAVETNKMSSRILYLAISASTLVLFAYYTCDMTSRLTGPPAIPIKSFADVEKYGYKIVVASEGMHAKYLKEVNPQIYKKSLKVKSLLIPVKLMLEHPNYLWFAEDSCCVTRKELVSLIIDETSPVHYGFAFQLNSEFTDLFNHHLLKMTEAGVIQRLRYPIQLQL